LVSPDEVTVTAYLTAVVRAEATADTCLEFKDEYASRFADLCPRWIRKITQVTAGPSVIVARTSIIDNIVSELVSAGSFDVCINLGAGFDSRPFRLNWPPGCLIVEVDAAPIFDVKDRLLPAVHQAVTLERLRCDVGDVGKLVDLLVPHTAGRRLLIICEGLLSYFSDSYIASLAAGLLKLGVSATWVCDVISPESAGRLTTAARAAGVGLELRGLRDLRAFETGGWTCESVSVLPTARLGIGTNSTSRRSERVTSRLPDAVVKLRSET
jgi:O-methyltransferase involved in polyketide biosynthesis